MRVLAISPHVDDVELGAGGYIARLLEEGNEIKVVAFSTGNPLSGASVSEFYASMDSLGVAQRQCWNFECRHFAEYRQDILGRMIVEYDHFDPDLVLVPSKANVHQDHEVVTAEAARAFRTCSILGYEMPWGDMRPFYPQHYVELSVPHISSKEKALKCYISQWNERPYMTTRTVIALATTRGMQIGKGYAEAFEVVRWLKNLNTNCS